MPVPFLTCDMRTESGNKRICLSVPEEWWEAQVTQEFDFIQKDD